MGATHCGYITTLKNVRPHTNANKLLLGTCFGNTVCVSLDYYEGMLGVYFPCDLQLSEEFCRVHDLVRRKNPETGEYEGGYMDPNKRNVKTIKLRGEPSDGLFMPLSCLDYCFSDGNATNHLSVGDTVDVVNGHEICKKYIPRSNKKIENTKDPKARKLRINVKEIFPYFEEHIDTPQLAYNQDMFKPGDVICLTEKVHGTSSRNANTIVVSYKRNFFDKLFKRKGKKVISYKHVVGTRRTIVQDVSDGYYGSNQFRIDWDKKFEGKLLPGEEVFGEIAGFTGPNAPIMSTCDNKKTKDKAFIKRYGDTTVFSYGCSIEKGDSRFFIYRMTYTSPEGYVFEYPWDYVKLRAEQMGFEVVPELERFIYTTQEDFMNRINSYMDIPSTIDSSHIIEGVVVRALNAPNTFRVAKNKSFNFKVIEGIMKTDASTPDIEEQDEIGQE